MRRIWLIEISDDRGTEVWRRETPYSQYSMPQMKDLLRLLTAKAELSFDQIVESSGKTRPDAEPSLEVRQSLRSYALRSGSRWSLSARLMLKDKDGTLHEPRPAHL